MFGRIPWKSISAPGHDSTAVLRPLLAAVTQTCEERLYFIHVQRMTFYGSELCHSQNIVGYMYKQLKHTKIKLHVQWFEEYSVFPNSSQAVLGGCALRGGLTTSIV